MYKAKGNPPRSFRLTWKHTERSSQLPGVTQHTHTTLTHPAQPLSGAHPGSPPLSPPRSFTANGGPQKPARLLDGQHGDFSLRFSARSEPSSWSWGSVPSKIGWRRISQPTDRQSASCSRDRSPDYICHFTSVLTVLVVPWKASNLSGPPRLSIPQPTITILLGLAPRACNFRYLGG